MNTEDEGVLGWQVFKLEEIEGSDSIADRDPINLILVGRIAKPSDKSEYWTPNASDVGKRFGAGQFLLLDDQAVIDWKQPSDYKREKHVMLDVVAETEYYAREDLA